MRASLDEFLQTTGAQTVLGFLTRYPLISQFLGLILVVVVCTMAYRLTRRWIESLLIPLLLKLSKHPWLDTLIRERPLEKMAHLPPALLAYHLSILTPLPVAMVQSLALIWMLWALISLSQDTLDAINHIYATYDISRNKPIKGFLQVFKLLLWLLGILLTFSLLLGKSPAFFLSGLGAITAILLLVFKDTILSIVASVQIQTNDMVRIGDWIEMPQYNADGDVIDMALHTVKVQNWDKTITTIPTSKLIEESFKNWRGMKQTGGRRISRSLLIDASSICFLDAGQIEGLCRVQFLKEHLQQKIQDVANENQLRKVSESHPLNGRRLTNLGTFRSYLEQYIENHSRVRNDLTRMVRLREPTESGIPLQIYCFLDATGWVEFESIQTEIFEHILTAVNEFGLALFQNPSGQSFARLGSGAVGLSYEHSQSRGAAKSSDTEGTSASQTPQPDWS